MLVLTRFVNLLRLLHVATQVTSEGDWQSSLESIHPPSDAVDAIRKINFVGELICQPEQVMM